MRRLFASGLLASIAGCYPALVHPTRVESAFRLGAAVSVSLVSDSASIAPDGRVQDEVTVLPSVDLQASLGIRDTSAGSPGLGLRLAAVLGLGGYGGSAYVELPRVWAGDIDAGVGVDLHRSALRVVMPYVQFGAMRGSASSWFVRNGVARVAARDSTEWKLLWLPTAGWYRHRRNGFDGGLYLTAVIGNQPLVVRECILFGCFAYGNAFMRTFLIFGTTVTFPLAGELRR